MLNIYAHRTHWCGIKEIQNTLEGMGMAIPANFNLEVDIRFQHIHVTQGVSGEVIDKITPFISHDPMTKKENPFPLETMFARFSDEFIHRKLTIAFHLKEGWLSNENIKEMKRLLRVYNVLRFFFFGFKTNSQKERWAKEFGWEQIADEVETKKGKDTSKLVNEACKSKSKYTWVAELGGEMLQNRHWEKLRQNRKHIILVSPDVFSNDITKFKDVVILATEKIPLFDGICTDHPTLFNQYSNGIKQT